MTKAARTAWLVAPLAFVAACVRAPAIDNATDAEPRRATTAGAIAVANLDHLIAQQVDDAGTIDLLLTRARFLADHDALDRACTLAESRAATLRDRLQRAHARAAAHRFADALADLDAVAALGAASDSEASVLARESILVATGRIAEAIPALEAGLARHPGFATRSALAAAYGAAGRLAEADHLYRAALTDLDTTSPFPYAWIAFARGRMWAEHGRDPARAEAQFARALDYLPAFAAAAIELAELEIARGDLAAARAHLAPIATPQGDPEALALLGALRLRTGDAGGRLDIARARERFETLLARHPLAFADHAAEFYLGPGADPARAWSLAQRNLAARPTERAHELAVAAARAVEASRSRPGGDQLTWPSLSGLRTP